MDLENHNDQEINPSDLSLNSSCFVLCMQQSSYITENRNIGPIITKTPTGRVKKIKPQPVIRKQIAKPIKRDVEWFAPYDSPDEFLAARDAICHRPIIVKSVIAPKSKQSVQKIPFKLKPVSEKPLENAYKSAFTVDITCLPKNLHELILKCSAGHLRKSIHVEQREYCEICELQATLRNYDPLCTTTRNEFNAADKEFEFICGTGHIFVTDYIHVHDGCRSCQTLLLAQRKHNTKELAMYPGCIFLNEHSDLRFHCNKLRHDPFCTRPGCVENKERHKKPASKCNNYIPCDQDFYASLHQIRTTIKTLSCECDHRCTTRAKPSTVNRILEQIFGTRFDDQPPFETKVEFTSYNAELKLAATHQSDKFPKMCLKRALIWCESNSIKHIMVTATDESMTETICTQLVQHGFFTDFEELCNIARDRRHKSDQIHKLYCDGGIFKT